MCRRQKRRVETLNRLFPYRERRATPLPLIGAGRSIRKRLAPPARALQSRYNSGAHGVGAPGVERGWWD
jgi:hypothetical protein